MNSVELKEKSTPDCTTSTAAVRPCPENINVAVRSSPVFCAAVTVTSALPVPEEGEQVSHSGEVTSQATFDETATLKDFPAFGNSRETGLTDNVWSVLHETAASDRIAEHTAVTILIFMFNLIGTNCKYSK